MVNICEDVSKCVGSAYARGCVPCVLGMFVFDLITLTFLRNFNRCVMHGVLLSVHCEIIDCKNYIQSCKLLQGLFILACIVVL